MFFFFRDSSGPTSLVAVGGLRLLKACLATTKACMFLLRSGSSILTNVDDEDEMITIWKIVPSLTFDLLHLLHLLHLLERIAHYR